jgi:hypothetical protein
VLVKRRLNCSCDRRMWSALNEGRGCPIRRSCAATSIECYHKRDVNRGEGKFRVFLSPGFTHDSLVHAQRWFQKLSAAYCSCLTSSSPLCVQYKGY